MSLLGLVCLRRTTTTSPRGLMCLRRTTPACRGGTWLRLRLFLLLATQYLKHEPNLCGQPVRVHGLTSAAHLNDRIGVAVALCGDRWIVDVFCFFPSVKTRVRNLESPAVCAACGTTVASVNGCPVCSDYSNT
mmetsp:Transcript_89932/g.253724  ORF Transcript_89932/g.253724 Transcript_89932/m.253724 type:complete len:133 (-) Transcript_89932:53-451(-)